ncbi:hypothetical protein ECP030230811_5081 [Escherichia coli P0302308.11]|nr:hypothetical protein ECP030230811_5081 [Escherichia coli P0302308.11]
MISGAPCTTAGDTRMTAWCFCCHACRLASSAVLKRAERAFDCASDSCF